MPPSSKNLKEAPECVILLHGMGRTRRSLSGLERWLQTQGYSTVNVGYPSLSESIRRLADEHLAPAIDRCRAEGNARVHFVAHSLGGIIVRQYLQDRAIPSGSRMVMLAPPNRGSELVDILNRLSLYRRIMGPSAQELGTGPDSTPNRLGGALIETGIIIGNRSIMPCAGRIFNGPNDGKVSVNRAKLEGMKDFLMIDAGHAFIMRKKVVRDQVVHFLKHGEFDRRASESHG